MATLAEEIRALFGVNDEKPLKALETFFLQKLCEQHKQQAAAEQQQLSLAPVKRTKLLEFHTNGPIFPASEKYDFVVRLENEDISDLFGAVENSRFLIFHGPRQAGKTTRQFALEAHLKSVNKSFLSTSLETVLSLSVEDAKTTLTLHAARTGPGCAAH